MFSILQRNLQTIDTITMNKSKVDTPTISDVEQFWNNNPLFTGEVLLNEDHPQVFFAAHDKVCFQDNLATLNIQDVFYLPKVDDKTLDLGCGIGFWSSFFVRKIGVYNLTSADLTNSALRLCKIRVPTTSIKKENAESLSFNNNEFSHVNCQGVIHHTPNTQSCLNEIYRVLNEGGTASVSVYYKNALLRVAKKTMPLMKLLSKVFLKNTGRGRNFSEVKNFDDLVRFYDGNKNPIGKVYSKREFELMLKKAGFRHIEFKFFFFPFRFFKFKYPNFMKGLLVRFFPFMIVANLKK